MDLLSVGKENGADVQLYYEDHGSGKPVVIKGCPHCVTWTHADVVNPGLLEFMQS
jgi:hypothetical protein